MSAHVSITMFQSAPPNARVLKSQSGHFISVEADEGVTLHISGYDAECANHARRLADELMRAAAQIDAALHPVLTESAPIVIEEVK